MRLPLIAATLALLATPAYADSIDGAWCKEGARLVIQGPNITTPGGARIQGQYGRHDFSYVAPAGEQAAGTRIELRLLGEYAMQSRSGPDGRIEDWRRCGPETS